MTYTALIPSIFYVAVGMFLAVTLSVTAQTDTESKLIYDARRLEKEGNLEQALELIVDLRSQMEARLTDSTTRSDLLGTLIVGGQLHAKLRRDAEALEWLETCAAILATEHPNDLNTRGSIEYKIAITLDRLDKEKQARTSYEEALRWCEAQDSTHAATVRLSFARHLVRWHHFFEATEVLAPLLQDKTNPRIRVMAHTTRGEILFETLRWEEAFRVLETAIENLKDGSELELARAHQSMGRLLNRLGSSKPAIAHNQEALRIREKHQSPTHPDAIKTRLSLATSLVKERNFAAVTELWKPLEEASWSGNSLASLMSHERATAYFEEGKFAMAANVLNEFHEQHPDLSAQCKPINYSNWAICQLLAGDQNGATRNIQRALQGLAGDPQTQGFLEQPFSVHFNHAMISHHLGKHDQALAAARKCLDLVKRGYREVFTNLPPNFRLAFSQQLLRYPSHLAGTLGNAEFAAEVATHAKGRLTESLARDRRLINASSRGSKQLEELESLQQAYATATIRNENTSQFEAKIQRLRSAILRHHPRREIDASTLPTTAKIIETLSPNELFIDFFEFRHNRGAKGWTWDIGVLALQRDAPLKLYTIPESKVTRLKTLLNDLHDRLKRPKAVTSTIGKPSTWSSEVFDIALGPLREEVQQAKTLSFSTDTAMHDIPFSMLQDKGKQALFQTHSIRYINSLRDLLRVSSRADDSKPRALLIGNPAFDTVIKSPTTTPARSRGVFLRINDDALPPKEVLSEDLLPALPGSARELQSIETILKDANYQVQALQGTEPTEQAIRQFTRGATILHFATHGFYFDANTPGQGFGISDPMYRSAITLTGAEHTISAWQHHTYPNTSQDGMLMASEIAELSLQDTRLVVLSACETAQGEALSGQGVQGLRNALSEAGCESVVSTLWKIDDESTVPLMQTFYQNYVDDVPAHEAMAKAQRSELMKRGGTLDWKTLFDLGAFLVTHQGSLN